jgi:hypothetical protein
VDANAKKGEVDEPNPSPNLLEQGTGGAINIRAAALIFVLKKKKK